MCRDKLPLYFMIVMDGGENNSTPSLWKVPVSSSVLYLAVLGLLGYLYQDGLAAMLAIWSGSEEYSHGFLIPLISLFLIWLKRDELLKTPFAPSWAGVFVVLLGLGIYFLGELSTLYIIVQYAFLITLYGVVLAMLGWRAFRIIWVPLLYLVFMIPLPAFILNNLSNELQLISSQLGVAFIRACDISVYLEGNVIDLGVYKLQVAEACSGLNYLFPLMSLAFLVAYLFKGAWWQKAVIFLSSIPITIVMNSFRIGVIGVLVDNWGISMAEGFLHFFEGWVIFLLCTALLVGEVWLFARLGRPRRRLGEVIGIEYPAPLPKGGAFRRRPVTASMVAVVPLLLLGIAGASVMTEREELVPERLSFNEFPMAVEGWQGRNDYLDREIIETLKFDDYVLANFLDDARRQVNFYVAYYGSQRKGESAHSPRSCIPGDGWQIASLAQRDIEGVRVGGAPLRVNRVEIHKGEYKQLVYYWFQQRGRVITNEYLVKWFLFWDALTKNRTDGALVRLTTLVQPGEDVALADARLRDFAVAVAGRLEGYVPG